MVLHLLWLFVATCIPTTRSAFLVFSVAASDQFSVALPRESSLLQQDSETSRPRPLESSPGEERLRNWMAFPSSNATLPLRTGNPYELPARISFGLISVGGRRGSAASGRRRRMRLERSAGHRVSASEHTRCRILV